MPLLQHHIAGFSTGNAVKILAVFLLWKLLLLLLAAVSPGPGYDTSTQLLLPDINRNSTLPTRCTAHVLDRLVRWDALYFTSTSERGYVYEQEWAFRSIYGLLVGHWTREFSNATSLPSALSHALTAVALSHLFHLLSSLLLYHMTYNILPGHHEWRRSTALVAACLHIVSPAGVFLSAPYAESMFAFFNFLGMFAVSALQPRASSMPDTARQTIRAVMSGMAFGFACMIRSNGLLSLLVYVQPGLILLHRLFYGPLRWSALVKLAGLSAGALHIVTAFCFPQWLAYREYCTGDITRPWCEGTIPSIYTFVQAHYWGVGFMKYWTLSNLPLFLVAGPMLVVLLITAIPCLTGSPLMTEKSNRDNVQATPTPDALQWFALPQIVLAVLALFNFHVQIINRISSGYPLWYIVLAIAMNSDHKPHTSGTNYSVIRYVSSKKTQKWLVRTMVMYAMIQGGLFASFLPPA